MNDRITIPLRGFLGAWLPIVLLFVAAATPRILNLSQFATLDEVNFWVPRSRLFLEALQSGDYAGTAIWAQPGVTTMWLGSAGILLHAWSPTIGLAPDSSFPTTLAWMRFPVSVVHTFGILLGYLLMRRLMSDGLAFLAALLWALDPFLIGYSRVLHVDALAATFLTCGLLALAWHISSHHQQPSHTHIVPLAISGCCVALAALSKSPALIALPTIAILIPMITIRAAQSSNLFHLLQRILWQYAIWGTAFALTILIMWPAVWADPHRVAELLRAGVADEGAQPHQWGNFYLGHPTDAPDWTFYPVALALRLPPWTALGLALLLLAAITRARQHHIPMIDSQAPVLLPLLLTSVLFLFVMSAFPKKFNRYLIPIIPSLSILAAYGLAWGTTQLQHVLARYCTPTLPPLLPFTTSIVALIAATTAALWHPYALSYFTPLLGGHPTGAYAFSTGWGEGLDQVADWLNQQPDITGVVTASMMVNSLRPFMKRGAHVETPPSTNTLAPNVGYVVIYIRQVQRSPLPPPFNQFYPHTTPIHTVMLHDVPYAWIYQVAPPIAHPTTLSFDSHITLHGYEIDDTILAQTGTLSLTLQWSADAPLAHDYLMFAHVFDSTGQLIGQIDTPPAGPTAPSHQWQHGRIMSWVHPLPIHMPAACAPPATSCSCWLSLGLYHPQTGQRLSIDIPRPPGAPDDGEYAALFPFPCPQVAP